MTSKGPGDEGPGKQQMEAGETPERDGVPTSPTAAAEPTSHGAPSAVLDPELLGFWFTQREPGWPVATLAHSGDRPVPRWLLVATNPDEGLLLDFTWGKRGYLVGGAPKGWKIRRDRDTARRTGEYHYHCKKDGKEYVVRADGRGSHKTVAGTALPRVLGDFLFDELGLPLAKSDGVYVVTFVPAWSWEPGLERWAVDFVEAALNADAVEVGS